MRTRTQPGPADSFEGLGDPWAIGNIDDKPSFDVMEREHAELDAAVARRREQLLLGAQTAMGKPIEYWTDTELRLVEDAIDRELMAGYRHQWGTSPESTLDVDPETGEIIRTGDPLPHGHQLPYGITGYLNRPQSVRDVEAFQGQVTEWLWQSWQERYPHLNDSAAVEAAVRKANAELAERGTSIEAELARHQGQNLDSILGAIAGQYEANDDYDDHDPGRTSMVGTGGAARHVSRQEDQGEDMGSQLAKVRPSWV